MEKENQRDALRAFKEFEKKMNSDTRLKSITDPEKVKKAVVSGPAMLPLGIMEGPENQLFLGTSEHALDETLLARLGMTHVVNCTKDVPNEFEKKNRQGFQLSYHRVPVDDMENEPIDLYFSSTINFIAAAIDEKQSNKVLVHCVAGLSRAAAIVIAFLVAHKKMGFKAAHDLLKGKRQRVRPNVGFAFHLSRLEMETSDKLSFSDDDIPHYYLEGKRLERFEAENLQTTVCKLKNGMIRYIKSKPFQTDELRKKIFNMIRQARDEDFNDTLGDVTVEVLTEAPKEESKHLMSFFKDCVQVGVFEKQSLKDAFHQLQENYDVSDLDSLFGPHVKSELRKVFSVVGVTFQKVDELEFRK